MKISLFFLFFSIVHAERTTPIVSIFCHYPDDSFSAQCHNLKTQFFDSDALISKYKQLLNNVTLSIANLTSQNDINLTILNNLQNRKKIVERFLTLFNSMEEPYAAKYPKRVSDINKKTEILFIIQGGSTPKNHPYDFAYLKSPMMVDIFPLNSVRLKLESFLLSASFINLKNTTKSVLSFHNFFKFISSSHHILNIDHKFDLLTQMEHLYKTYIKSFDKTVIEKKKAISAVSDKYQIVRINGDDAGKVTFLTLSNCILSIDTTPLRIKNVGLLDNVYLLDGSQKINCDYAIISSCEYLYSYAGTDKRNPKVAHLLDKLASNGVNSLLDDLRLLHFKRLALWSDLNTMMPCRMGLGFKGVRITFGSPGSTECAMTEDYRGVDHSDVFVPFSLVEQQLSFVFLFNESLEIRVLSMKEENGIYVVPPTETPRPTETESEEPIPPPPPPPPPPPIDGDGEFDIKDIDIVGVKRSIYPKHFQYLDDDEQSAFFSISQEINLSIQLKSFINPLTESGLVDDSLPDPIAIRKKIIKENANSLQIYFTGAWERLTAPLKLFIESEDYPIEYIDLPDKVVTINKGIPYSYSIIDKGKINPAVIAGVVVGCALVLGLFGFLFVYCFVVKKKPIENQIYN